MKTTFNETGGVIMPASVEKVLGKPIAIVNYHGEITTEDARAVFAQIAGLVDTYGAPLYRLTCIHSENASMSFDEVMMMTTLSSKGLRGSPTDPNVTTVLVGEHPFIDLYADAMRQDAFGGVEIPIFENQAEAMVYITELIHRQGRV